MNKSKFLKKSLAAVLAVLMIAAMIPLSAAAYDAEVTEISINGTRATGGPTNWNITIPAPAVGTLVNVVLGNHGGVVRHYDDNNTDTAQPNAGANNTWTIPMTASEVNDGKSGKVEFDIFDSVGATETQQHITLNWTLAEGSNDVSIKTVVAKNGSTVVQYGDTEIDPDASNTYLITLPYNALSANQKIYVTPNSSTATVRYGTGTQATPESDGSWSFPITIGANRESVTRFDVVNGTSIKNYVVKTTNASAFAEFSVAGERKAAKIDNENKKVTVYMPYGTKTDANKKLNIVPTFKKGYEEITYKITKNADSSKVDFESGKQIDANAYFGTALAASTAIKDSADETTANGGGSFSTISVDVAYSDASTETWTIEFQAPTNDPDPTLKGLKVGNFAAEINEENHTAILKLPASLRVTNSQALQGLASPSAKVLIVDTNAVAQTIQPNASAVPANLTGVWRNLACDADDGTADVDIDLKNKDSYFIRVTAAGDAKGGTSGDKKIQDYRLTIETIDTVGAPAITEMILEKNDEAKTQYKATITDTTILFNLPFSVYGPSSLNGWKLYYGLSNGSHLTAGITDPSGLTLTGRESYLPTTLDGKTLGSTAIDVENELGKTSYSIAIKQAAPSNASTMTGFKVTTAATFEDIKDGENTFAATANGRDLTVELPYSVYESMKTANTLNTFNIVANLPEGARVFYVDRAHSVGGTKYPDNFVLHDKASRNGYVAGDAQNGLNVMSKGGDTLNAVYALPDVKDTRFGYNGEIKVSGTTEVQKLMLVVISQKAGTNSANGNSLVTYPKEFNKFTTGEFTTYTLTIKQGKPNQLAQLDSFSVYDDATNTRISASVDNTANKINLTLPASFVGTTKLSPGGVTRSLYFDYATSHYEKITPKVNSATDISAAFNKLTLKKNGDVDTGATPAPSAVAKAANANGTGTLYLGGTANGTNDVHFVRVESEAFVLNKDNGQARDYELIVKYEEPRKQAALTSVTINGVTGTPDANGKVSITLPKGTDLTGLKPTFNISNYGYMTSDGNVAAANGNNLLNSGDLMNFTGARKVYVFSEDGTVKRDYTLDVKANDGFSDVKPGDWFYSYVMDASKRGIIIGNGDGTFGPYTNVTRVQFATMMARVDDFKPAEWEGKASQFSDMNGITGEAAAAVAYCADKGYITGDGGATTFRPNATITRQEMAVIISRVMKLNTEDVNIGTPFADDAKIAGWAKNYVYACVNANMLMGEGNNTFNPLGNTIRAAAATAAVRVDNAK